METNSGVRKYCRGNQRVKRIMLTEMLIKTRKGHPRQQGRYFLDKSKYTRKIKHRKDWRDDT
jgi:hypothetical protein